MTTIAKKTQTAKKTLKRSPAQELLSIARDKAKSCKTWPELHNAVYGVGAPFSRVFPAPSDRTTFAGTWEHKQIAALIEALPGPGDEQPPAKSFSGKVLVRIPKSIHAALVQEADLENVSLNQLIVSKLSLNLRSAVRA